MLLGVATSSIAIALGPICQLISSIPKSAAGQFWFVVRFLWPWYWIWIVLFFTAWTIAERIIGGSSENGFSSVYNRIVGAGVYALFQFFTYSALAYFWGDIVYCQMWPFVVHYFIFTITGGLLHISGFWPYWKIPFIGKVRLY